MNKKETYIREVRNMNFKNPILIEGLPGIGMIGKIVTKFIARELRAKKIAEVYSPHFPHQVVMKRDGKIRMLRNVIYGWKKGKKEFIFLLGDVQAVSSEGQYEVTNKILDYMEKLNVKRIITVGGYGRGTEVKEQKILGATTNNKVRKIFEKEGIVFGEAKGTIIGAAGMLLGLGKLRNMNGICIMGETHGGYVDYKIAKLVAKKIAKIFKLKLNFKRFPKDKSTEIEKKLLEASKTELENENNLSYIR